MAKFVSLDNLKTFLAELRKLFVVQESGKTLSTNDYTTTEKDKLATIEASAQENKIESITLGTSVLPIVGKNVRIFAGVKVHDDNRLIEPGETIKW